MATIDAAAPAGAGRALAPDPAAHPRRLAVRGADAAGAGGGGRLAAPAHDLVRVHRRQPRRPVGRPQFIGFANFDYLLTDPDWWVAVRNTMVFTICSVTIETILGLGIALALNAHFQRPRPAARRRPDPLGDPDRGLGPDVVVDVQRRVRDHQRHPDEPGPHRPADRLDRLARHRAGRRDHRRRLEDHAVHGAADPGRPADAALRVLRGGQGRRRPPVARVLEGHPAAAASRRCWSRSSSAPWTPCASST